MKEILDYASWYINNRLSGINAFIAIKDGSILLEEYYNGHGPTESSHVASITKSIISILIGIAIDNGYIKDIYRPVKDFFPHVNSQVGSIKIKDLLTMSSGVTFSSVDIMRDKNWIQEINTLPINTKLKGHFNYDDGSAHLLSAIITETTGLSAKHFADRFLFSNLGIDSAEWSTDSNNISPGGWGLSLTARDLAKIGWMMNNNGKYESSQILNSKWVVESTAEHIGVPDSRGIESSYGYFWWMGKQNNHQFYFARGKWEQYIINVPEINMTFVFSGSDKITRCNIGKFWRTFLLQKIT